MHAVGRDGAVLVRRKLRRAELIGIFNDLTAWLVGMEACTSAHHCARELIDLGHKVRLMPPVYVKPYVKRGKTDAADAEAICEVTHLKMQMPYTAAPCCYGSGQCSSTRFESSWPGTWS